MFDIDISLIHLRLLIPVLSAHIKHNPNPYHSLHMTHTHIHRYLLNIGQTTNENLRETYRDISNPFNNGFCGNACR